MWPFSKSYPEVRVDQVATRIKPQDSTKVAADENATYDYIVVGGGTAGCVVASRLSEDPSLRVLLVERGTFSDSWLSRVPLLSSNFDAASAPAYKWSTIPQVNVGNEEMRVVAGKALGGTSRINSMLYTRGSPAEWDAWAKAGRTGWSHKDMLPYFLRSEKASDDIPGEYHSRTGSWFVRKFDTWYFPFWPTVVSAASTLNIPTITDINDPAAPICGAALIHRTQTLDGKRVDTATAFLPVDVISERKDRLKICTGALVSKVVLEKSAEDSGPVATGVVLEDEKGGPPYFARAKKEVIVCAGTFGSPQLLMLSGIGPRAHLEEHKVPVSKDLHGVGQHLMDHTGVPISYTVPLKYSLHALQGSIPTAISHLFQYLTSKTGWFLLPIAQVSLFLKSALLSNETSELATAPSDPPSPENGATATMSPIDPHNTANIPDLEVIPVPINLNPAETFTTKTGIFSLLTILVRPSSTGSVTLRSVNPRDLPVVDLNFLSSENDVQVLRKGLRFSMVLGKRMQDTKWAPMAPHQLPSPDASDEELDAYIRKHAQTEYHYSSTCRMAPEVEGGVVDDELRVHGVKGLRVADASVFPKVLSVHTMAPCVAVAERVVGFIRGEDLTRK